MKLTFSEMPKQFLNPQHRSCITRENRALRWWSWLNGERCATKRVEFERRQRAATLEPFLTATTIVALNCEPNDSSLCKERREDVPVDPMVCLGMGKWVQRLRGTVRNNAPHTHLCISNCEK